MREPTQVLEARQEKALSLHHLPGRPCARCHFKVHVPRNVEQERELFPFHRLGDGNEPAAVTHYAREAGNRHLLVSPQARAEVFEALAEHVIRLDKYREELDGKGLARAQLGQDLLLRRGGGANGAPSHEPPGALPQRVQCVDEGQVVGVLAAEALLIGNQGEQGPAHEIRP